MKKNTNQKFATKNPIILTFLICVMLLNGLFPAFSNAVLPADDDRIAICTASGLVLVSPDGSTPPEPVDNSAKQHCIWCLLQDANSRLSGDPENVVIEPVRYISHIISVVLDESPRVISPPFYQCWHLRAPPSLESFT